MLVLSRHRDEAIVLLTTQGLVKITVVDIRNDKIRLGIEAPNEMPVHRLEVHEAIQWEAKRRKEGGQ
jgi:carbon storage regulator